MANSGLDHVCKRQQPELLQGMAQARRLPGTATEVRTDGIFVSNHVENGRIVAERLVHVGARCARRRAHAVDYDVRAVRAPDMHDAAADHADHHWLNDGQREQAGDCCIDRIAAVRQYLAPAAEASGWLVTTILAPQAGRLSHSNDTVACARQFDVIAVLAPGSV